MGLLRGVTAAMVALGLATAPALASGGPDLNVGFIGSLSGPDAFMAQDSLDGFKLGVKHLGGRLGGVEFDLTSMDDRRDPEIARGLAEKLQRELRPQFLLLSSDPKSSALIAPMADAGRTFLILLNAPAANLAGKDCHPYVFSLAGLGETVNEVAGQYMAGQGYRRVTLVQSGTPAGQPLAEAFRRGFRGEVTDLVSHRGEMAYDREMHDLLQTKPDAIYLLQSGGMAVNFIRQYADQGVKGEIPLFGPATILDQAVLAAAAPESQDLFSIGPWSEDFDSPANRRMMSDFEGEYGRPPSLYAAMGYDAAMLIDAAMRGADKKINNDELVRTALRRADFATTRSGFRFDTNQFPIQTYVLRAAQRDNHGHMVNEQRGPLARDARDGHAAECPMRWVVEPVPPPPPKH